MEQRPLRLGNTVDDYCPRERRLTNHVIVAIVDQTIRQTRCTTCDAEHPYKDGKIPRRKKPDGAAADLAGGQLVIARAQTSEPELEPEQAPAVAAPMSPPPAAPVARQPVAPPPAMAAAPAADAPAPAADGERELWTSHRQLIRAQLPKVEGEQPPPRPIPEFTMHQRPQGRGGGHGYRQGHQPWHGGHGGNGHARSSNGFRPERDGNIVTPPRSGGGPGAGPGPGGGGGRRRHRGRHKPPPR